MSSNALVSKEVIYKEPVRLAVVSGLIIATAATLATGTTADAPTLTSADHVHLIVFSPFISNTSSGASAPAMTNGIYQVWDVPYWTPPNQGNGKTYAAMAEGCWTWPF